MPEVRTSVKRYLSKGLQDLQRLSYLSTETFESYFSTEAFESMFFPRESK
jgi:hypothetical protein